MALSKILAFPPQPGNCSRSQTERNRIARELHDGLLQGFFSVSMQLHVAVEDLPAESPMRERFGRVLRLMDHVLEAGRTAVQGLRSPQDEVRVLALAFARVPSELGFGSTSGFRVVVEGWPRPLKPLFRDEVYRIGREAIVNAHRHSRAKRIVMHINYRPVSLRIVVRDNGCGIDRQVLQQGRNGHWGLQGMRERAERIGACLRVWSRVNSGTEIEVRAPGRVAYEQLP